MTFYMKITGINGDVTSKGHEGWIALSSLDCGVRRNLATRVGQVVNREATLPSFQEIEITKCIDSSTPGLYQSACLGKTIPEVEIHACSTGDELTPYAKYLLNDVIVSSYHEASLGEEHPFEKITLNFVKIQKTYIARDKENRPKSPVVFGFDLERAQRL